MLMPKEFSSQDKSRAVRVTGRAAYGSGTARLASGFGGRGRLGSLLPCASRRPILRAHLYLEYYMTEHLRYENPGIGDLDSARLTFSQKVALLRVDDEATKSLAHGIRHLNKIRNKLAHNLSIVVTKDDADIFLSVRVFKLIRDAVATHTTTSPSNAAIVNVVVVSLHANCFNSGV